MLKKDYKADLAKTTRGTYIIKVSEFYGTDFVGPEQVEVTEEVLDYLRCEQYPNTPHKAVCTFQSFL